MHVPTYSNTVWLASVMQATKTAKLANLNEYLKEMHVWTSNWLARKRKRKRWQSNTDRFNREYHRLSPHSFQHVMAEIPATMNVGYSYHHCTELVLRWRITCTELVLRWSVSCTELVLRWGVSCTELVLRWGVSLCRVRVLRRARFSRVSSNGHHRGVVGGDDEGVVDDDVTWPGVIARDTRLHNTASVKTRRRKNATRHAIATDAGETRRASRVQHAKGGGQHGLCDRVVS